MALLALNNTLIAWTTLLQPEVQMIQNNSSKYEMYTLISIKIISTIKTFKN